MQRYNGWVASQSLHEREIARGVGVGRVFFSVSTVRRRGQRKAQGEGWAGGAVLLPSTPLEGRKEKRWDVFVSGCLIV